MLQRQASADVEEEHDGHESELGLRERATPRVPALPEPATVAPRSLGVAGAAVSAQNVGRESHAEWERAYADVPLAAMEQEARAIEDEVFSETQEEITRRFASGQYDVVASDGKITVGGKSSASYGFRRGLTRIAVVSDGEVRRVALSRDEFPAMHALIDKAEWLEDQVKERLKNKQWQAFPHVK